MYSYFQHEEIKITDAKGFVKFLYEYPKTEMGKNYETELDKAKLEFLESGSFSLEFMDGWKIIQYWYNNTLDFLDNLAKYIEGYVVFEYETNDEKANIRFEGGSCYIDIYKREWAKTETYNSTDLISEERV